jgi:hypothetical protein
MSEKVEMVFKKVNGSMELWNGLVKYESWEDEGVWKFMTEEGTGVKVCINVESDTIDYILSGGEVFIWSPVLDYIRKYPEESGIYDYNEVTGVLRIVDIETGDWYKEEV